MRANDETMNGDELVRRADVAMYHAKARGKHRCATYAPEFDDQENGAPPARAVVRRPVTAA